jgi:NAD(P)-dependent dehydrogenase (short-subunit alcohol dehydrogenase family)
MAQGSRSRKESVVITGASTGIGRACALHLSKKGYEVFAGVRRERDGENLRKAAQGSLRPVIIDVTEPEQIKAAAHEVGQATTRLRCLINNAGIGVPAPTEVVTVEAMRRQFEVNVFGQIAVTQAFLPLLRASQGRILNIGSIADRLTMPFAGPLNASKHAFASFNDALRFELRPWGLHVVLIEPAAIHSSAAEGVEAIGARVIQDFSPQQRYMYEDAFKTMLARMNEHMTRMGSSPESVAKVVHRAMTTDKPKTRYLVGKLARPLATISSLASDRAFDAIKARLFNQAREFGQRGTDPALSEWSTSDSMG